MQSAKVYKILKRVYALLIMIVLLVSFSTFVTALTKIDASIYEKLEQKVSIEVGVTLKDISGVDVNSAKNVEERDFLIKESEKLNGKDTVELVKSLMSDEFVLTPDGEVSYRYFRGNITKRGLDRLKNDPRVLRIYVPVPAQVLVEESKNIIGANTLHEKNYKGKYKTVCVIDTGIDNDHNDFKNRIVAESCYCRLNEGGSPDCCPDGSAQQNGSGSALDNNGHGTHIAGIIAGNGWLTKGIAPEANIMAIKVCNSAGSCDADDISAAINRCKNDKDLFNISVISISLGANQLNGSPYSESSDCDALNTGIAVSNTYDSGIFVSVASGNDGFTTGISSPACSSKAVSVGATYDKEFNRQPDSGVWSSANCFDNNVKVDNVTCFTNRHTILDVLAPGCRIKSTDLDGVFPDEECGTSQATPHVSGTVALLSAANSYLSPFELKNLLVSYGKLIRDSSNSRSNGLPSNLFFPRIDTLSTFAFDWPTDHHDFRRTGFTLLKGDVNKASDIDASNIALKDTISSDILIRPSVADLDGNGHQDVVTVMYQLGSGGNTDVYAIERRDRILNRWWMRTKERWHAIIPVSYPLLPPTLANIDSDSGKEVLVGLRNGTLIAYDITSGGQDQKAVEKWRYKFSEKYTAVGGANIIDYGGGTAVADIDLDGNNEVITADFGTRTAHDWPGEVFVFDGTSGAKEGNATFGNGGAFGSVSVANVDSDDNPEIIVPSFYGVFVYDYNSSAPNKLTKKCDTTTDGGLIDGSVVVYDIDRDNQYELIYTTANQLCHASKSCSNRLYIKNAQTCADESPSPISLNVYSRVTPTIANLDADSNYEIVISGRLNTQTEDGKIIAYDASTGAQQWSYDDSGTLKTAFVAPDIADMNGDGRYDIVFGENNGSKVHIVNSSGGKNFTYNFNAFVDSALAIADIDNDGKAEIALKREGSPYGILAVAGGFNQPPQLGGNISNRTARAGELIDLNASGEVAASDPDGNTLIFSFSSPFNGSGKWQTTVNDTGNYSILVEVSDGSLSDYRFIDVYVFNQSTNFVGNFSDGAKSKLISYSVAGNQTVSVRLPKNAAVIYSRLRLEGKSS